MKKIFFSLLVAAQLFITAQAHSQESGYRWLTAEETQRLASSLEVAFRDTHYHVDTGGRTCNTAYVIKLAREATSAQVNAKAAQPLFIIDKVYAQDPRYKERIILSTTADYKKVVAYKIVNMVLGLVNRGDLLNPALENGWYENRSYSCLKD